MFFKKRKVLDLTESHSKDVERMRNIRDSMNSQSSTIPEVSQSPQDSPDLPGATPFGFLNNLATSSTSSEATPQVETYGATDSIDNTNQGLASSDERRGKLAKRLMDMTDKIEDLSNQIYHLQQRLEVAERKLSVRDSRGFE